MGGALLPLTFLTFVEFTLAALTASWKKASPDAECAWLESFRTSSPPRSGACAVPCNGGVLLFGGYAEPEEGPRHVVNDLLRYADGTWQQLHEPMSVSVGITGQV